MNQNIVGNKVGQAFETLLAKYIYSIIRIKLVVAILLFTTIPTFSQKQKSYMEIYIPAPKTVFDSILVAKFKLTFFQYQNKTYSLVYKDDNYLGYLGLFSISYVHTKKFPPIWINGGYALTEDISEIQKYKKVLSFRWVPIQKNIRNSADVGEFRFHAE